jgi:hypothetical protein
MQTHLPKRNESPIRLTQGWSRQAAVCLDERGGSQFNQLPVFYAFDLLWLDNEDLRRLPLIVRKTSGSARGSGLPGR